MVFGGILKKENQIKNNIMKTNHIIVGAVLAIVIFLLIKNKDTKESGYKTCDCPPGKRCGCGVRNN